MKKTYFIPKLKIKRVQQESPLAVSGVVSNNGIGYGGVDTEGTREAEVKGNPFGGSIFDDI